MAGAKTAALGRMLTALGALWMGWSVFIGLFELGREIEGLGLPFLPGLLFFFVGRAMTKAGKTEPLPDEAASRQEPRRETRAPRPETRPSSVGRREPPRPEPEAMTSPQPEPEMPAEMPGLSSLEDEILELPPPMTSEEMVAEARRRFGPRPLERPESGDN
ncbi:MAG: hypothetical protein ACRDVL_11200 [Acidimicrobiia bacterium]